MRVTGAVVNFIAERDHRLMRRCNRWKAPRWVRMASLYATRAGDGWLWFVVAATILALGGEERFRAVAAGAAAWGPELSATVIVAGRRRRRWEPELSALPLPTSSPPS